MLEIPRAVFDGMLEHARGELPHECCGLLAGRNEQVVELIRLRNELASAVAYSADPADLFAAFRRLRAGQFELLAIYHSHPRSRALPSRVDLAQNYYDDTPRIIISLIDEQPDVRMFRLGATDYDELGFAIT